MRLIRWLTPNTDVHEVEQICREALGTEVHPADIRHLVVESAVDQLYLPRLEKHLKYLFGTIFLPSDINNLSADFDSVVFVVTHDAVVARLNIHPLSKRDWSNEMERLTQIAHTSGAPFGGRFLLNLLATTVDQQTLDATSLRGFLKPEVGLIQEGLDLTKGLGELKERRRATSHSRRLLLQKINEFLPTVGKISGELPTMRRIAEGTLVILESLVTNQPSTDLHEDIESKQRELFPDNLEIYLADHLVDCRRLVATIDKIEFYLSLFVDRARQLADEDHVKAGRFNGAITSIMLLPTFIVGLYGQNFVDMPETDWHYGYLYSWGAIILLTAFQITLFKRRRWI